MELSSSFLLGDNIYSNLCQASVLGLGGRSSIWSLRGNDVKECAIISMRQKSCLELEENLGGFEECFFCSNFASKLLLDSEALLSSTWQLGDDIHSD